MPGKDGTGPLGHGPVSGRNINGRGQPKGVGAGPLGYCVCPKCREKIIHTEGVLCFSLKCPKCGTSMIKGC